MNIQEGAKKVAVLIQDGELSDAEVFEFRDLIQNNRDNCQWEKETRGYETETAASNPKDAFVKQVNRELDKLDSKYQFRGFHFKKFGDCANREKDVCEPNRTGGFQLLAEWTERGAF